MTYKILTGNNLDVLPTLADNSVDAIVTDPPYELGFMGKKWDSSGIAYSVELWTECLRVLKPGGHLLAFSGSRTYHRMTVAIEDSGFEIRDMISWISNKTFPKSLNISKAIDKTNPERSVEWDGWGTGLKPTVEPIVMARKPVEGTVAANVLKYGTGGINIDESRISTDDETARTPSPVSKNSPAEMGKGQAMGGNGSPLGRWPANIIIDEQTAELIDEQSGNLKGGVWNNTAGARHFNNNGLPTQHETKKKDETIGGASRFFYVARASKADRNEGLDDSNTHPTVKPTALMEYLIKLVTSPNGTVLDPFTGSGSTGKAAILQGFDFIGIEMTEEYLPIIEGRLQHAQRTVAERKEKETTNTEETLF